MELQYTPQHSQTIWYWRHLFLPFPLTLLGGWVGLYVLLWCVVKTFVSHRHSHFPLLSWFSTKKKEKSPSVFIYSFIQLYVLNKCKTISRDLSHWLSTRNIYFYFFQVFFSGRSVCQSQSTQIQQPRLIIITKLLQYILDNICNDKSLISYFIRPKF